eukprot:2392858-Amphidinium_carterae.1
MTVRPLVRERGKERASNIGNTHPRAAGQLPCCFTLLIFCTTFVWVHATVDWQLRPCLSVLCSQGRNG